MLSLILALQTAVAIAAATANSAYNYAVAVAANVGWQISGAVGTAAQQVKDFAQGLVNGLRSRTDSQVGTLERAVQSTLDYVRNNPDMKWLLEKVPPLYDSIASLRLAGTELQRQDALLDIKHLDLMLRLERAQAEMRAIQTTASLAEHGLSIAMNLIDQMGWIDSYAEFLAMLKKYARQLQYFLENPLRWFLTYLVEVFEAVLCTVLAYILAGPRDNVSLNALTGGVVSGGGAVDTETVDLSGERIAAPCSPLSISGYRFTPPHNGTDFGIGQGQNIFAAHDGVVEYVERGATGYGRYMTVRGGNFWTLYDVGIEEREPLGPALDLRARRARARRSRR